MNARRKSGAPRPGGGAAQPVLLLGRTPISSKPQPAPSLFGRFPEPVRYARGA